LMPLTLPTMGVHGGRANDPTSRWQDLFPNVANLKVYIGDYSTIGDPARFPFRTVTMLPSGDFSQLYYMRLPKACDRSFRIGRSTLHWGARGNPLPSH